MRGAIGGEWHDRACAWFDNVIPVQDKLLFDAGCGLGHFMIAFEKLGAKVFGCDSSNYSKSIANEIGLTGFYHTSVEDMECVESNKYDIIYCGSTMEHIPHGVVEAAVKNIIRIAKPKAYIYMEVDTKPDSERSMPEASHVNIRPWGRWLGEFDRMIYDWLPEYGLTEALRGADDNAEFPLPDWNFFVYQKSDL